MRHPECIIYKETGNNTLEYNALNNFVQNMAEITQQQVQVRIQKLHCYITYHLKCIP